MGGGASGLNGTEDGKGTHHTREEAVCIVCMYIQTYSVCKYVSLRSESRFLFIFVSEVS